MNPSTRALRYVLDPETLRLWPLPAGGADDDDDEGETEHVRISKSDLDDLRAAAERGSKRAGEIVDVRKENAFLKVGIDTDSEVGQLLYESVQPDDEGNFDTEALRERAEKLGALSNPSNDGGPEPEPGEEQSTAERQSLAGTGTPPPEADPGEHPNERAKRAYEDVLDNNGKTDVAQAAYAQEIFAAASEGDDRVLVRTEAPAETV